MSRAITIHDPDESYRKLLEEAIEKHSDQLLYDEMKPTGLLKLIIKNIDLAIEAVRPSKPKL